MNPYRFNNNIGNENTSNGSNNSLPSATTDLPQQFFTASSRRGISASSRIPSSPHSDTAAIHSNPPSAGQLRPLSVPPQMMDHNYQRSDFLQSDGDSNSVSADFLSFAANRRPPQLQQQQPHQTIAEVEEMEEDEERVQKPTEFNTKMDEPEVVTLDESTTAIDQSIAKMHGSIGEGVEMAENSPIINQQQHSVNPASAQAGSSIDPSESQSPSKGNRTEEEAQNHQKSAQQQEEEQLIRQRRREPVVLDWRALEMAMLPPAADEPSPLEQFLLGQTLLTRLLPFFELAEKEARQRERGKLNLPVKEVHWAQGVLSIKFPSYPMPVVSVFSDNAQPPHPPIQQCQIHLQLFICPKEFRLKANLEYHDREGGISNCPIDSDIRIFERFFATHVTRMNSEMAVFAFITLCRLSSPSIYASLAQLLLAQMEPQQNYPWRVEFELLHLTEEKQPTQGGKGEQPQKNVQISIQVTDMCKQFLLIIYLRSNTPNQSSARGAKHKIERWPIILRYVVQNNELNCYHPPVTEADQQIANVLKTQTELIKQDQLEGGQQQCCIWPCIRALLEGQHQQEKADTMASSQYVASGEKGARN